MLESLESVVVNEIDINWFHHQGNIVFEDVFHQFASETRKKSYDLYSLRSLQESWYPWPWLASTLWQPGIYLCSWRKCSWMSGGAVSLGCFVEIFGLGSWATPWLCFTGPATNAISLECCSGGASLWAYLSSIVSSIVSSILWTTTVEFQKKLYCVSYIILSSLQPMENHKHSEHTFVIEPKLTASSVVCLDACRCTPPTSTWAFSKAPHQSATGCGQMFGVWPKLYPLELVTCPVLNRLPALDRLSRNTRTPGESRDVLVWRRNWRKASTKTELIYPLAFLDMCFPEIYIYICVHVPVKLHISISGITLLSLHPSFAIKLWSLDMTFGVISISFLFFCEQWTLGWIMSLCWMVKCHCHHMLVFTQDSNWSFCRGLEQIYIVHTCGSLRNWWMRNRFLHRLRNGPTLTLAWPTLRSSSNTAFPSWLGKMRTGGLKRLGMKHAIVILSKNLGIWHTYIHGMTPGSRTCVSVSSWLKRLLKLVAICQYSSLPYQMDNCSSLDLVTHKTWRFLKPFTHLRLWPAQADIWPVLEYLALSKNTIVPGRWVSWTNPGTEAVFMILCVHLASGMAPWPIWANWSTWNGFTPWHPR